MSDAGSVGSMPVSAFMADVVIHVGPEASLLDVADELTDNDIGVVAVTEADRVVGVISERDLVHALAKRLDPAAVKARDVAETNLVWCDASSTVAEVATEMLTRYVRHALVEDGANVVGVVSNRDLLGAYAAADAEPGSE